MSTSPDPDTPTRPDDAGRSRRRGLIAAVALAGGGAGAWFAARHFRLDPPENQPKALFATLSLPDASGAPFPLAQLDGQFVVLNFWATWCPPCIEEMPELAELHREISPRRGTVIGIGIDSPTNIREFASKHRFPYPLLVGGMGGTELSKRFGNVSGALPFTVLISRKGSVVGRKLGRIRLPELREQVLAHLG